MALNAHLIFGNLLSGSWQVECLGSTISYSRRLPLHPHPSQVSYDVTKPSWSGRMDLHTSSDVALLKRNDPDNPVRTTSKTIGGGGTEWAAWYELSHKDDEIITSSIPFFCDSFLNLPILLPDNEAGSTAGKRRRVFWHPTITMTVEFKARIPSSDHHSDRTVGVYSESRFLTDPYGRHNARVEVWTAPSRIGQGDVVEGWRDEQYCIAVADQMALTLPIEVNLRKGTVDTTKL
ncbi:hypothetical protein BU15DRAFT_72772 [Melanogaster broomeanus]|nr:hypothetical protein BU15DRAFT_72772 [Melanogaster broomeanus]